jgi:hypothetical protein
MYVANENPRECKMMHLCGVDPGIVNMSYWVGSFDPETGAIKTFELKKERIGGGLTIGDNSIATTPKSNVKQSVQSATADSAIHIADACVNHHVASTIVETAPQWNIPIRISAATLYGVLRGRGVSNVKYSSPTTKSTAMKYFAEKLGIEGLLETSPDGKGSNKMDKKVSAKERLVNKRNAIRIVERVLERYDDDVGRNIFMTDKTKRDDMADAILLACGLGLKLHAERRKNECREIRKKMISERKKLKEIDLENRKKRKERGK